MQQEQQLKKEMEAELVRQRFDIKRRAAKDRQEQVIEQQRIVQSWYSDLDIIYVIGIPRETVRNRT